MPNVIQSLNAHLAAFDDSAAVHSSNRQLLRNLIVSLGTWTLPAGNGSPEGNLAAPPGILAIQADAVNGPVIWQKIKGTDVYGWAPFQQPLPVPSLATNAGGLMSFGDSVGVGQGASPTTKGFNNILAAALGGVNTVNAVGGTGAYSAIAGFFAVGPAATPRPQTATFISWMSGFNDLRRNGAATKTLAKIQNCLRAFIALAFGNTSVAANNGAVTAVGAWTAFAPANSTTRASQIAGGALSGVSGMTLSWNFTGDSLIIGTWVSDGVTYSHGPATITVDGVLVQTYDPDNRTDNIADGGAWDNGRVPGAIILRGLGSGAHTVVVAPTHASKPFVVDYFSTLVPPGGAGPLLVAVPPRMPAAGYALAPNLGSDAAFATAASRIMDVVLELPDYPMRAVFVNSQYDLANVSGDNIHPANAGHYQIAQAYEYVFQSAVLQSSWFSNAYGMPQTTLATDGLSSYPTGISIRRAQTANGWPLDGFIVTVIENLVSTSALQILYRFNADVTPWIRTFSAGAWGTWGPLGVDNVKLNAAPLASAVNTTYPLGISIRRATPGNGFPVDGFVITTREDNLSLYTLQVLHAYNADVPPQMRTWISSAAWSVWRTMGRTHIAPTNRYVGNGNVSNTAHNIVAGIHWMYITGNTAAAAFALTLPPAQDGAVLIVVFGNNTGAITYTAAAPATATIGLTTPAVANVPVKMVYHAATTTWYPA